MYGVVNTPRIVVDDVSLGDAEMKKGDMVLAMLSLAGRDDRYNENPDQFDIGRSSHKHMVFGGGPHVCAGQYLARVELRILLEEWIKRISAFRLADDFEVEFRSWNVMAMTDLVLKVEAEC